uniref:Uncharacterized protein n=1 Tax=Timema bartmani TaxID=61472 RepID=A0A7R9FA08_9NEOP|nr:unnamed protein product [Timema bartmani]
MIEEKHIQAKASPGSVEWRGMAGGTTFYGTQFRNKVYIGGGIPILEIVVRVPRCEWKPSTASYYQFGRGQQCSPWEVDLEQTSKLCNGTEIVLLAASVAGRNVEYIYCSSSLFWFADDGEVGL